MVNYGVVLFVFVSINSGYLVCVCDFIVYSNILYWDIVVFLWKLKW